MEVGTAAADGGGGEDGSGNADNDEFLPGIDGSSASDGANNNVVDDDDVGGFSTAAVESSSSARGDEDVINLGCDDSEFDDDKFRLLPLSLVSIDAITDVVVDTASTSILST